MIYISEYMTVRKSDKICLKDSCSSVVSGLVVKHGMCESKNCHCNN